MKKLIFILSLFLSVIGFSQVTKSSFSGVVKSTKGELIPGASIEFVHRPTGTKYYAQTDKMGRYAVQSIKPGGPYVAKASFVGYKTAEITDINAPLGNEINVNIGLEEEQNALKEVVVKSSKGNNLFSKNRTGASQQFSTREINSIPVTGSRSINAITKYNANAGSGGSFGGQDSRLNNFTIDGSVFNNGFGLGGDAQAGGRTGSTAISLDAIEQLQVNIAPYDVRQSGFLGSGINAVTRSGTNQIEGSAYTSMRSYKKNFVGNYAGEKRINAGDFQENIYGARLGLPIVKNKLFFFGNVERIKGISPATNWTAAGSSQPSGQVARTTAADLQKVSDLLQKLNYTTGPWENFDSKAVSEKFLLRLDWNINKNNNLNLRYVNHESESDELVSNSSSAGFGNRRTNANSMAYKNGGYTIQDNTRSIVLELDSKLSNTVSNNFIAGYDKQIEDRGMQGSVFPTIDILSGSTTYISAGLDPFTKGNKLNYSTLHFSDNLTFTIGKHTIVAGLNFEKFRSENEFITANNAAYVFNSVADFEKTVNESIALNGAITELNKPAQVFYNYYVVPNPVQVFQSYKLDEYIQDDFKLNSRFNVTLGLRVSKVWYENTAVGNKFLTGYVDSAGKTIAPLTFANGQQFDSSQMPNEQLLFEPRLGFNLDAFGNKTTQLRGGTGVFTGRPPYVLLSNAIGNSGALINGFIDRTNTTRGFTTNPEQYFTPTVLEPSPRFQLNATDLNYKFPQVWKSNLAVDQKLPYGFVGTVEAIYGQNINAANYYDANLENPVGTFAGSDNRPRFEGTTNGVRVQNDISGAYVLTNNNQGHFYSATVKVEYPYQKGLWGSFAYTNSKAYDLNSVGSTVASAYNGVASVNGNNDLSLSKSNNNTPNRLVGVLGYKLEYGGKLGGATAINLGYIGEKAGSFSYVVGGDLNRDGISGNDLMYIPNSASELRFAPLTVTNTVNGVAVNTTYSEADQQKAFDDYINQDEYLSSNRGGYAQRNGATLPMLHRLDLSITQDIFIKSGSKKNSLQIRADILNFTNLLNNSWGVSQRVTNVNVLSSNSYDAAKNLPVYRLATQTLDDAAQTRVLIKDTYQKNSSVSDVWQAQLTLRYTFGN